MITAPRVPELAWSHASAGGELVGLEWVDIDVAAAHEPHVLVEGEDGSVRLRHVPYARFMPPPMVEAIRAVQETGGASVLHGVMLIFARLEWFIAARARVWTTATPGPWILETLVEAHGIGHDVHRSDPVALARVADLLPQWHPVRGTAEQALRVLEAAQIDAGVAVGGLQGEGVQILSRSAEVLALHDEEWWADRLHDPAASPPTLRLQAGTLTQVDAQGRFGLRREDVVLPWKLEDPAPPAAWCRLLPSWTSVRRVHARETP